MLAAMIKNFQFILNHPLNRGRRWSTLKRYVSWQLGARLVPGDVLVPFVDSTFLKMRPGMSGATGNVYMGLHEFEDMAFLLHLLRKGDFFVDVGANIGSYTILAGGAVGAQCMAIEPIQATCKVLESNIGLNQLDGLVQVLNIGAGKEVGTLKFTTGLDTVNHVLSNDELADKAAEVRVEALDSLLDAFRPTLIKIDVEGFETNVVAGAEKVLSSPSLLAVIMELNGSGERYGFDEGALHQKMLSYGFATYAYEPFDRRLVSLGSAAHKTGNTLYLRNLEEVNGRVKGSSKYWIANAAVAI